MNRIPRIAGLLIITLIAGLLSGCAGLGQYLPGGAKPTDAYMKGSTGAPELVTTVVKGTEKLMGCTIELKRKGESEPWILLLEGDLKRFCDLDENTWVTVNGLPDSDGVIRPSDINPDGVGR